MSDPIAPSRFTVPLCVVSQFEQDPNAIRIQKLLIYVCQGRWESDSARLNTSKWRSLIEAVKESHPTIEQLRSRLIHQIGTLNKSAEYAPIGQMILSVLERVYAQHSTTIVTAPKRSTTLDQDVNISRIKKLLIYTCRQYWEANSSIIEQTSVADLLDELIQRYTSLEELRSGLTKIVKTLNKPIEYSMVAEIILREAEPPYGKEIDHSASPESIDLFDIRREILKYANPLQAKILLFSSVYYQFDFCPQDWSNLKLYSLDGLLRTVLTQVDTIEEFQQLLNGKASQLRDPESYLEIVPILTRSLKSNYNNLRQKLLFSLKTSSVADTTLASSTRATL